MRINKFLLPILLLIGFAAAGQDPWQKYVPVRNFGEKILRQKTDSAQTLPDDTLRSAPCNSIAFKGDVFYKKICSDGIWHPIDGGTVIRLNDTMFLIGSDTMKIKGGGGSASYKIKRQLDGVVLDSTNSAASKVPLADTTAPGVMSVYDKRKLDRLEVINVTSDLRLITSQRTDVIYRLLDQYAQIGDFIWVPGNTMADDSVMIVKVPSITTGRFVRVVSNYLDARWFGAKGDNGVTDNWPMLQKAANTITHSNGFWPAVLRLPYAPGYYYITKPLILANLNTGTHRYEQTTITIEGDPGNARLSARPPTIYGNFKNAFVVGLQLVKGGGVRGVGVRSPWSNPTVSDSAFFSMSLSEYYDPTFRYQYQFSPQALICVDPFKYGSVSDDGGYPTLTSWYTDASSQPSYNSGSSGLTFYDNQLVGGNVGICITPNGSTQNAEGITIIGNYFENLRIGVSSGQDQEKSNKIVDNLFWSQIHTCITNQAYGIGTAGLIYVDNLQTAGRVNRIFDWSVGGTHPSFVSRIYSEYLGSVGTFSGNAGMTIPIYDSHFGFVTSPTENGGKSPLFHINAGSDVTFYSSLFRQYGTGYPVIIKGSPRFEKCTFENVPYIDPDYSFSSPGGPQFINCNILSYKPYKYLGFTGKITGSDNQFQGYSPYGHYNIAFNSQQQYDVYSGYKVDNDDLKLILYTNDIAITVAADRTFTFSSGGSKFYRPGEALSMSIVDYGASQFAGIITDTAGGVVKVSYVPRGVTTGTHKFIVNYDKAMYGFIGNTVNGSPYVTKVITERLGISVGQVLYSNVFGGITIVKAIRSDTVVMETNATITSTGNMFRSEGVQLYYTGKAPFVPLLSSIPNNTPFKIGDILTDYNGAVVSRKICIKDGVLNATGGETRLAVFRDMDYNAGPESLSQVLTNGNNASTQDLTVRDMTSRDVTVRSVSGTGSAFGDYPISSTNTASSLPTLGKFFAPNVANGDRAIWYLGKSHASPFLNDFIFQYWHVGNDNRQNNFFIGVSEGAAGFKVDGNGNMGAGVAYDENLSSSYRLYIKGGKAHYNTHPTFTDNQDIPDWQTVKDTAVAIRARFDSLFLGRKLIDSLKPYLLFDTLKTLYTTDDTPTEFDSLYVPVDKMMEFDITIMYHNQADNKKGSLHQRIWVWNSAGVYDYQLGDSDSFNQGGSILGIYIGVIQLTAGGVVSYEIAGIPTTNITWTLQRSPRLHTLTSL